MTRKLHNSVTALFATSGLLLLSLMAANPVRNAFSPVGEATVAPVVAQPAPQVAKIAAQARHAAAAAQRIEARAADLQARVDSAADTNAKVGEVVGFVAEAITLATIAEAKDKAEAGDLAAIEETTPERKPARKRAIGRQSVSMPFFSFAPRG